eukprot:scaffold3.g6184.t1
MEEAIARQLLRRGKEHAAWGKSQRRGPRGGGGEQGTAYRDLDEAVLAQLNFTAESHGLDAKQLANSFDKFITTTRQDKQQFDLSDVDVFRAHLLANGGRKAAPAGQFETIHSKPSIFDVVIVDSGKGDGTAQDGGADAQQQQQQPSQRITPFLTKSRPSASRATPASSGKFAERAGAGAVQAVLNPEIEAPAAEAGDAMDVDAGAQGAARRRCEVRVLGVALPRGVRYMVDRTEDKVAYQEGRILALTAEAEAALAVAGGGETADAAADGEPAGGAASLALCPVGIAAQQPAVFVGRIVCDAEAGRLNAQSLLLEGSQRDSEGLRVRLDVSQCAAGCRLFPGQAVLAKGTNPSGHCVVAGEVLPGLPRPLPRSSLAELAGHAAAGGGRGLSLVVAAGPYTVADDLAYEPLAALLEHCAAHRPDVLLLAGPFVDAEHPRIKDGLLDELFEEVYQSRVVAQLEKFCSSPAGRQTRVLLLPAVRDVHHDPLFPQPPLEAVAVPGREEGAVLPVANPATLQLNEVVLGCSSADWLLGVGAQEAAEGPAAAGDRMGALAAHLLAQRSYFPMFPPPPGACLDASKAAALDMPCTPDLLVVPSSLAPFARLVPVAVGGLADPPQPDGDIVVVNPGRLARGSTGGTFAHVYIAPHKEAAEVAAGAPPATNAPVPHRVGERCRVEIRKI